MTTLTTKCDNCDLPAIYCVNDPGANPVYYCSSCLPSWQRDRAAANHFPIPHAPLPEVTTEKSKKATSSDEDK
jgi:hypothetical protein